MNLKSIEYFLIAAEDMNFTRAAGRLYISQQALSSHIRRLEEEYCVQLFERKPALHLTPEGEQMVFYARQILDSEKKMRAAFSDISVNCRGTLKVGISRLRSNIFFPDIWKHYRPSHPNISIELVNGKSSDLDALLQAGKIDLYLGINLAPNPNQRCIELAREAIFCCFSRELLMQYYPDSWQELLTEFKKYGADLGAVTGLPLGTLRKGNRLRDELESSFAHYRKPDIAFESEQQELVYQFAKSGAMAGLLSPIIFYQYREELKKLDGEFFVFPLRSPLEVSIFSLACRTDYPLPRYAMDFIQVACMVIRNYAKFIYTD